MSVTTRVRALLLATLVVSSVLVAGAGAGAAAVSDEANPDADAWQGYYLHYGTETYASYDRGQLDDPTDNLQVEDDEGEVVDLPAEVNSTQDTPVGVNFSKTDALAYTTFPRVDAEDENAETWSNHSNWTTSSGGTSSITLSDAETAPGTPAVEFDTSVVDTETATGTFDREVSVTSDVDKRVAFIGLTITDLTGDVEVRFIDADGDYYAANASTEANASVDDKIANSTGTYVFQSKMNDLATGDNGSADADGTVDAIHSVDVVALDGNTDVTVFALDAERKSTLELGEVMRDTDGDGDDETTTITEIDGTHESGVVGLTSLDSMGEWADSAVLHDLEVYNVRYPAHLADAEARVDVENASGYSAYPSKVNASVRTEAPAYIDVSRSTGELRADKTLVGERYILVEYATGVGDTDLGNVSDSSFTEATSYLESNSNATGDAVTLASGISSDTTVEIHSVYLVTDDEADAIMSTGGVAVGPMDDGGGGGGIFGFSPIQWLLSGLVAVGGFLGIRRFRG